MPLTINIIGAGIAGLTAALALRKQGHHVNLWEKSPAVQETGAAIHLGPNCTGILQRLGMEPLKVGANLLRGMAQYSGNGDTKMKVRDALFSSKPCMLARWKLFQKDIHAKEPCWLRVVIELWISTVDRTIALVCLTNVQQMDLTEVNKQWTNPWLLIHRKVLHRELARLALDPKGEGPVPVLHLSSAIETLDVERGNVWLAGDIVLKGDVIVGADGNFSHARKWVEPKIQPRLWGKSCYRWLVERDELLSDPDVKELIGELISFCQSGSSPFRHC